MALAIDTTIRGEDANSYCTLVELNDYYEANAIFDVFWDALSDTEKTQFAVLATRAIDRMDFVNYKYDEDQALEFPRVREDSDEIPDKVKQAQGEILIFIYNDQNATTSQSDSSDTIESVNIYQAVSVKFKSGDLTKVDEKQSASGGSMETVKNLLRDWLQPVGAGTFDIVR